MGDLATPVTPTSFVLTAQTAVLLNAGEVTLTVTADAVTSSAMTAEPQAAATVSVAPAIPAPASSELAAAPASDGLSSAPGAQAENGASGDSKWGSGALIVVLAGVVLLLGLGVTRYSAARRARRPRPEPARRHRPFSQPLAEGDSELKTARQPQPGEFLGKRSRQERPGSR